MRCHSTTDGRIAKRTRALVNIAEDPYRAYVDKKIGEVWSSMAWPIIRWVLLARLHTQDDRHAALCDARFRFYHIRQMATVVNVDAWLALRVCVPGGLSLTMSFATHLVFNGPLGDQFYYLRVLLTDINQIFGICRSTRGWA